MKHCDDRRKELPSNIPYAIGIVWPYRCPPKARKPIFTSVQEEKVAAARHEQLLKEEKLNRFRNKWAKHLQRRMLEGAAKRDYQKLIADYEDQLLERRERLAIFLEEEENQYLNELKHSLETPQERDNRLLAKAKKLRENKSQHEAEYSQQKRKEQFQKDCDDLRLVTSHQHFGAILADRTEQLKEKHALDELKKKQEQYYNCLWYQDYLKKVQREESDENTRRNKAAETVNVLMKQMEDKNASKRKLEELKKEEAKFIAKQKEMFAQEDEWEKQQQLQKQKELKKLLDETVEQTRRVKELRQQEEDEFNRIHNTYIQHNYSDDPSARSQRKLEMKEEYDRYLKNVANVRAVRAISEMDRSKAIQAENEQIWEKKKALKCLNNKISRQNLEDTLRIRDEQLKYKYAQEMEEKELLSREHEQLNRDTAMYKQLNTEEEMRRRQIARGYWDDWQKQQEYAEARKQEEQQETSKEFEAYKKQEAKYQDMVETLRKDSRFGYIHPMRQEARNLQEELPILKNNAVSSIEKQIEALDVQCDKIGQGDAPLSLASYRRGVENEKLPPISKPSNILAYYPCD